MVKEEIPENYYGQDRKLLPTGPKTGRQERSNFTPRYTYTKEMTVTPTGRLAGKCI